MAVTFNIPQAVDSTPVSIVGMDSVAIQTYDYLKQALGYDDAKRIWMAGQKIMDFEQRMMFYSQIVIECEREIHGVHVPMPETFAQYGVYRWQPVDIETFVTDPYYLNKSKEIYPEVLRHLILINSGEYVELVATGGIGSAKTTLALYTNAYQLYLLSCMRSPHKLYGMDSSSEILLIFQSMTKELAEGVDYKRFRDMIEGSQYFIDKYPHDRKLKSKMVFPNRIEVHPVSGEETAAIGQNVIGGLIDELNYMAVTEKSKRSIDNQSFDQAVALYNSIARRRQSRFMKNGKMPGILCLVSSKRYPGQFTDTKEEEARQQIALNGFTTIYIYDMRAWDIKPWAFIGEWFKVFVGDLTRKPRIMIEGEVLPEADAHLSMDIPIEYLKAFQDDIINALREIAGMATLARHPYFMETGKVAAAFKPAQPSLFTVNDTDFITTKLAVRTKFYKPELPRWAHIDLAISGDSAGLTLGCVDRFVKMEESTFGKGEISYMPHYHIDGTLEIKPPRNSEIQFWKIREVLLKLRAKGLNIRWISFDSFESTDSMQLLRQQGFITGKQSMDVNSIPYDITKSAIYDGRVDMPVNNHLLREILMLERDMKTGKIDHPPQGSKDTSDSLAGVIFGLFMRREIWSTFSIPLTSIPNSIASMKTDAMEDKNARLAADQQQQGSAQRRANRLASK